MNYAIAITMMFLSADLESHTHQPNFDEVAALREIVAVKKNATDRLEAPPIQILSDVENLPANVAAQMPNMLSLKRTIRRERAKKLPTNPERVEDLLQIPGDFRVTKNGEDFLMYDSFEDRTWDSNERIIMYSTDDNLRRLSRSATWYLDGTFKVVPAIFFQIFVIMGSVVQVLQGKERKFAVPLVYVLLTSKTQVSNL